MAETEVDVSNDGRRNQGRNFFSRKIVVVPGNIELIIYPFGIIPETLIFLLVRHRRMLTRREKLLVRPWQLRRYNTHRKKVLSALPVIDFGPPPKRGHVTVKLKKLQLEDERKTKIEEDNFRLLQRMGEIMKKNRIDNYWERKPPNFLGRVGIYHRTRTPSPIDFLSSDSIQIESNYRKSRCLACSGQLAKWKSPSVEGRIPWEPARKTLSTRIETDFSPSSVAKTGNSRKKKKSTGNGSNSSREVKGNESISQFPAINSRKSEEIGENCEKRIVLEEGSFKLSLNFPIYVDVKVKSAKGEKYIQRGYCDCHAIENSNRSKKKLASV